MRSRNVQLHGHPVTTRLGGQEGTCSSHTHSSNGTLLVARGHHNYHTRICILKNSCLGVGVGDRLPGGIGDCLRAFHNGLGLLHIA